MTPVTEPLQEIDIDIPDADMYEEKFREQERQRDSRKYVHLIIWVAPDASTFDMTACDQFWRGPGKREKPGDVRCSECVEYAHTHRWGVG